ASWRSATATEPGCSTGGARADSRRGSWAGRRTGRSSAGGSRPGACCSGRQLYRPHAEAFAALVADRETLGELYTRVARAIDERDGDGAAAAIAELAEAQAAWMLSR